MAKNDIKIKDVAGANVLPTILCQTEANATAILAGEPVKFKTLGSQYVIPLADADGVIGTMTPIVGIAASDSTQTASADGTIQVYMALPGTIYEVKAKTASTVDTQAEINALVNDRAIIDLTSSTYTIDATGTDVITAPFLIVGGNVDNRSLFVMIRTGATALGDQDIA